MAGPGRRKTGDEIESLWLWFLGCTWPLVLTLNNGLQFKQLHDPPDLSTAAMKLQGYALMPVGRVMLLNLLDSLFN